MTDGCCFASIYQSASESLLPGIVHSLSRRDCQAPKPDTSRPKTDSPLAADVSRPTWNAIRVEAFSLNEPLLQPEIDRLVLSHSCFESSLACLLSEKLFQPDDDAWQQEIKNTMRRNPNIASSTFRDLDAIQRKDPATAKLVQPYLYFKGFHALAAYRLAHRWWFDGRQTLACHLQSRISEQFGIDIHPAAQIGSGVFFDHGTGIVIGETAVIGDDVTILHGVTLGGTGKVSGDRHPKVQNDVMIGAHAQLLGNISIGAHAIIGASSVVLKDVAPGATVAGVPAKLVSAEGIGSPSVGFNRHSTGKHIARAS